MGALTYDRRLMRDRVHILPEIPDPTPADAAAIVYKIEWWAPHGHSSVRFEVLALDVTHAFEAAVLYLQLKGDNPNDCSRVELTPWEDASIDVKGQILRSEDPELAALRQQRYTERPTS